MMYDRRRPACPIVGCAAIGVSPKSGVKFGRYKFAAGRAAMVADRYHNNNNNNDINLVNWIIYAVCEYVYCVM